MSEMARALTGVKLSYLDLIEDKCKPATDSRTGDEIALDIINRAGLEVKKDESI